eukprot:Amastigsp_a510313_21.p1 type:complete len:350 gc:universal Amastigsp_a510313_21:54-1103(+)
MAAGVSAAAPAAAPAAVTLNEDASLAALCVHGELRVFLTEPPMFELYRETLEFAESIEHMALLGRSQLVALAGTDRFGNARAWILDMRESRAVLEFESLEHICALRLTRGFVALGTERHVAFFALSRRPGEPRVLSARVPSTALLGLAGDIAAFPHADEGRGGVVVLTRPEAGAPTVEFEAHKTLAAIALSGDGRLLATASKDGTIVRLWTTELVECDASARRVCAMRIALGSTPLSRPPEVVALAFGPLGARPLVATLDALSSGLGVRVLETERGTFDHGTFAPQHTLAASLAPVGDAHAVAFGFCSGARLLVVRSDGRTSTVAISLGGDGTAGGARADVDETALALV